jgi:hypothetical protein
MSAVITVITITVAEVGSAGLRFAEVDHARVLQADQPTTTLNLM